MSFKFPIQPLLLWICLTAVESDCCSLLFFLLSYFSALWIFRWQNSIISWCLPLFDSCLPVMFRQADSRVLGETPVLLSSETSGFFSKLWSTSKTLLISIQHENWSLDIGWKHLRWAKCWKWGVRLWRQMLFLSSIVVMGWLVSCAIIQFLICKGASELILALMSFGDEAWQTNKQKVKELEVHLEHPQC